MEKGSSRQIIIAGIFGNALEWYDFSVYAFFVPIIAKLYFPSSNEFTSLLQTFGVFALGFLIRPLGAILFGYLGDHFGRKKALILSIIVMSLPTFLLGLLPTYQQIGIAAPLLLILLRLIQGTAVSGELTTATSFLVEHAPSDKRGWAGSLAMASAFIGIVLSSAIASLVSEILTEEALYQWGFRIPFLFGGLIGAIGIMIRIKTAETSAYESVSSDTLPVSMWQHLKSLNYSIVMVAVLLTAVMAIGNYYLVAFFNTFLIEAESLPLRHVTIINFFSLTLMTIMIPIMGVLSDKFGRKKILLAGMVGIILIAYPVFWLLATGNIWLAFLGEAIFACVIAATAGVIPTALAEMFTTFHRNTGIAVSYNLSLAIFGGTAPLVAMFLMTITYSPYAPAWYIIGFGLIGLLALYRIPETYQKPL